MFVAIANWVRLPIVMLTAFISFQSLGAQEQPSTDSLSKTPTPANAADQESEKGEEEKSAFDIPPEVAAAGADAKKEFTEVRDRLAKVMGDMRETHLRYQNDEDRSPQALTLFRKQSEASRKVMLELFEAALEVTRIMPDEECMRYMTTMIEFRLNRDFYDESMMEAGARLIDMGVAQNPRMHYLFLGTMRAAIISGDFSLARRLIEVLDVEKLNKADAALVRTIDQLEEQWIQEQELIEQDREKGDNPKVKMETTQGDVVIELFINQAPSTVSNFIQLVEKGYYDGLDFFQVIDNLLALTGDESGVGEGNTGKFLMDEHGPESRKGLAGSLVMAKHPIPETGTFVPNSSSAQWAILFLPMSHVSEEQTVFGRVIEGMDAIGCLYRVDPSKKNKKKILMPPDRILSMSVINRPKELPEVKYYDHAAHAGHNHPPGQAH